MENLTIQAPAKINLLLRIVGKRADGYHQLVMVMQKISLADEIILEPRPQALELICEDQSDLGMMAEKNLAFRAAKLFKEVTSDSRGVRIFLKKRIPIAAGLGGGSADAGAVLTGLNTLWEKGLKPAELAKIGVRLGADVPFFCYHCSLALVQGIGEKIKPLEPLVPMYILLINPGFSVSTRWAYEKWDEEYGSQLTPKALDVRSAPILADFKDIVASLHNDLESVTLKAHPEIAEVKQYLINQGASGVMMSGSGPTVFGFFASQEELTQAAQRLSRANWKLYLSKTI